MSLLKSINEVTLKKLLAFDFLFRLIFLLSTLDTFYNGDAIGRARSNSIFNFTSFFSLPHYDWLPIPFWFQWFFMELFDGEMFAQRLIGIVFASLSVIPLYLITKKLFSKSNAIYTSILFTFCTTLLLIANVPNSEPFYVFFALLSLYLLYEEHISKKDFVFVCLVFICSNLCRYESWLISIYLIIFGYLLKNKMFTIFSLLGTVIAIFYWEYLIYESSGVIFKGLLYSDYEVEVAYLSDPRMNMRISMFFYGFAHFSFFAFPYALFKVYKTKDLKQVSYLGLAIFISFASFYKLFTGTLLPEYRYFVLHGILLFPFCVEMLQDITLRFKKVSIKIIFSFYLVLSLILFVTYIDKNKLMPKSFQKGFFESLDYYHEYIGQDNLVYLDYSKFQENDLWLIYSKREFRDKKFTKCSMETSEFYRGSFKQSHFERCILNEKNIYLIVLEKGHLEKELEREGSYFNKFKQTKVFDNGVKIYRMEKNEI